MLKDLEKALGLASQKTLRQIRPIISRIDDIEKTLENQKITS